MTADPYEYNTSDPYVYKATVDVVHDGDTVKLLIDMGFDTYKHTDVRLLGCNARELKEPGGLEALANLRTLLPMGSNIMIRTVKPDKFGGRYDAAVYLGDGTNLVAKLVAEQWAAAWNGNGPKPVPPWPRTVTS